jgi:hypothetical protein
LKFTVGGRPLELTKDEVVETMRGVIPEDFREHLVMVDEWAYPPKQVLAEVTGWPRQSFTTMEAQRVLSRLGFRGMRRSEYTLSNGKRPWLASDGSESDEPDVVSRLNSLEQSLVVTNEAVAGLVLRVKALEAGES